MSSWATSMLKLGCATSKVLHRPLWDKLKKHPRRLPHQLRRESPTEDHEDILQETITQTLDVDITQWCHQDIYQSCVVTNNQDKDFPLVNCGHYSSATVASPVDALCPRSCPCAVSVSAVFRVTSVLMGEVVLPQCESRYSLVEMISATAMIKSFGP